jgi:hypothetical protein
MTTIHAQAERKRQDRSVCRAEKRLCRARMLRVRGLIHPTSAVCATTDTARGEKRLPSEQNQAILKSSGRPLGECRLKFWRLSIEMSLRIMSDHLSPIKSAARPIGQISFLMLPCITPNPFNYDTSLVSMV